MNLETLDIQTGQSGRQFRNVWVSKGDNCWYHIFKYLDNNEYKGIKIDSYGRKTAIDHKNCKKIMQS